MKLIKKNIIYVLHNLGDELNVFYKFNRKVYKKFTQDLRRKQTTPTAWFNKINKKNLIYVLRKTSSKISKSRFSKNSHKICAEGKPRRRRGSIKLIKRVFA